MERKKRSFASPKDRAEHIGKLELDLRASRCLVASLLEEKDKLLDQNRNQGMD